MEGNRDNGQEELQSMAIINQYQHIRDNNKARRKNKILIAVCLALICGLLICMLILTVTKSEKPEQVKNMCMKCSALSEVIDRWAWKDVEENKSTDECCFTTENRLAATLKYYIDMRLTGNHDEISRLQEEFNDLENRMYNHMVNGPNSTAASFPDISKLKELLDKLLSRQTAVLHLISDRINISEGLEPTIHWDKEAHQGNISLANDHVSVQIMNTALYHVTAQVKFRVNVPSNHTRNTTVQFYVAKIRAKQLSRVDDYKKRYVFHDKMPEHDALLQTVTLLERGDRLIIRFPKSQKTYLAVEPGSHRISIFELS